MSEDLFLKYLRKDLKPYVKESDCCEGIVELRKEIERLTKRLEEAQLGYLALDNIINELETYICTLEYDRRLDNNVWTTAVLIHNRLKELKEVKVNVKM